MEIDVFHLFLWEPFAFEGTPFEMNRVSLLTLLAGVLCLGFFLVATRRISLVPKGLQNVAESGYLFVRNNIAVDVIGPEGTRFAPYLATIFFFIFFCNLLEIVPGINFPVTSRMAIPAALAILTWIIFNAIGFGRNGLRYLKETLFPPGLPWWVYFILAPIEFASVFLIRPFTLAVRLLANMLAGHVLLTVFFLFTQQLIIENFGFGSPLGVVT
ncbi:MAG: F0F1 ATP synthase subunit A, partial [Actinomycetota bacterium]